VLEVARSSKVIREEDANGGASERAWRPGRRGLAVNLPLVGPTHQGHHAHERCLCWRSYCASGRLTSAAFRHPQVVFPAIVRRPITPRTPANPVSFMPIRASVHGGGRLLASFSKHRPHQRPCLSPHLFGSWTEVTASYTGTLAAGGACGCLGKHDNLVLGLLGVESPYRIRYRHVRPPAQPAAMR
jgi:hypothetical protein